jgi:hypothetical protein
MKWTGHVANMLGKEEHRYKSLADKHDHLGDLGIDRRN